MGFVLKIYFLGLISFVPAADGGDLTVLLVDGRNGYSLSDGTWMAAHEPLLLVRSNRCEGDCRGGFQPIADFLYQIAPEENARRLTQAIGGGGAWWLDGSDLTLDYPEPDGRSRPGLRIAGRGRTLPAMAAAAQLPAAPEDLRHFGWVTEIGSIVPSAARVDPDVLAPRPQKGLIAARLTLADGEVTTERLVSIDDEVVALEFRPLRQERAQNPDRRPAADRVAITIQVPGCEATIGERRFDGGPGRTMTVFPEKCDGSEVVEVAVVNLTGDSFGPLARHHSIEMIGMHFEMYYELAHMRPPNSLRPVPLPAMRLARSAEDDDNPPPPELDESRLLTSLGLPGRGVHSRPLCPESQLEPPP